MSQQLNLYNPDLVQERSAITAQSLLWFIVLCLAVGVALHFYLRYYTQHTQKLLQAATQQLTTVKGQLEGLKNAEVPKIKNPALEAELKQLESSYAKRQQIAAILQSTDFGNTEGYSVYFTAFARQIPSDTWLTGLRIEGAAHDIQLNGRSLQAESIPAFVAQLKREKIMQGKAFAALQMERPLVKEQVESQTVKSTQVQVHAPYLEFELHSVEPKRAEATGAKQP